MIKVVLSGKGIQKLKMMVCHQLTSKLNNLEFDGTLVDLAEAEKVLQEKKIVEVV